MAHVLAVLPQFALACFVIAVLPGPAFALLLHRTVRDGRRSGLAATAGNEIGVFAWALAAGAGLTTLLQANRLVFAFSFFPQFLPRHGPVLATTVVLAIIQVVIDTACCAAIVLLAARVRPWLSRAAIRRRMERLLGTLLIGLGVQLAAEAR